MLETEIGKSGEVIVEGHAIGRLDGFMFAPDTSASAGSEAKALNAAAQKALAGEIEARATRLSQCANDQIVLANDGAVRWLGDAVGRLTPGDEPLRPRLRILADEHLTGPARDLVQTRLDLWLKTHIEKQLAPLFSLTAAEDVTGMARGIAFQLVEALGVLERQRVAEEVKGLDQPARATLRKYGVRFGAYHIYLPALLKPAPRALATQLWALKNEAPDAKGVAELLHLAASGRTSIPVDKETPKPLYRTAGYRVCGERAVRVDILERLADLIRPALSWREGSSAAKPDGAVDGRSFTVTGAMTSLTGASGEDFASILRALGYRMERRPKPAEPEKPAEAAAEATPAAETSTEAPAETPTELAAEPSAEATAEPVVEAASEAPLPDTEQMPQAGEPVPGSAPEPEPAVEAAPVETEAAPEATPAEAAAEPATEQPAELSATAASSADTTSEESGFFEVWRPGGRSERRRRAVRIVRNQPSRNPRPPRRRRQRHRVKPLPRLRKPAANRRSARAAPAATSRLTVKPGATATSASSVPSAIPSAPGRGPPRRDGKRRRRDDGPDRAEREQYYAKPFGGGGARNKEPDPNSPFAKLAALKAQLEQKEP